MNWILHNRRYDIIYKEYGIGWDYHSCREWNGDEGCYGTNLDHGFTWEGLQNEFMCYYNRLKTLDKLTEESQKLNIGY